MPSGRKSKRARHLERLAQARRARRQEAELKHLDDKREGDSSRESEQPAAVHCEECDRSSDPEEDNEFTEVENDKSHQDAFQLLMSSRGDSSKHLRYQRGPEHSERQQRRKRHTAAELAAATNGSRSIKRYFGKPEAQSGKPEAQSSMPEAVSEAVPDVKQAITDLKKTLRSKKIALEGENLIRHEAVLSFLNICQSRKPGETREELALAAARCYGRGKYFARKIITWELQWKKDRTIEEGRQGCSSKDNHC